MKQFLIVLQLVLLFGPLSFSQERWDFQWEGKARDCYVYLPQSRGAQAGLPVVFNLYGYGGSYYEARTYHHSHILGDSVGFITVYPDAFNKRWNSGLGDNPDWPTPNVDDVGFISLIIDSLISRYKIDTARVYACGNSNGGFMCLKLAGRLGNRIAAVASVSGVVANSTAASYATTRLVPVLTMNGTSDNLLPYYDSTITGLFSVDQTTEFVRNKNFCLLPAEVISIPDINPNDQSTVVKYLYRSSTNTSQVVHYKIIGGGHEWPGSPTYAGATVINRDIDAIKEIWNFFKQFTISNVIPAGARIAVNPLVVDFGNIEAGVSSDTLVVSLYNYGSDQLTVTAISENSPMFSLVNLPTLPVNITSLASTSFNVLFKPTAAGAISDTVVIASNDTTNPIAKIVLRGKGISIGPAAAGVMYATQSGQSDGSLYKIGTLSAEAISIGSLGVSQIRSLAIQPSTKKLYGISSNSITTSLYRISADSGSSAFVKTIPVGDINAIAFSTGDTLYGATSTGKLYRINLNSSTAVLVGTAADIQYWGLSFSPSGKLWAAARNFRDSIYIINTSTGLTHAVGEIGLSAIPRSIAFNPAGVMYCLIDNGSGENYLATLDTLNGIATLVSENPMSVSNLTAIAISSNIVNSVSLGNNVHLPTEFSLSQNYPNPFNPSTMISYQLPTTSNVNLKIFDLLGREIATLVNEEQIAGWKEVQWNATGFASGLYLVKMESTNFVETKKILLMK
ncbi:MAG: T9SS type A sorting domain-containing protein [Bacteroidota bacterium]